MTELKKQDLDVLGKLYNALHSGIVREYKRDIQDSIFILFLKLPLKKRVRTLDEAAIDLASIPTLSKIELEERELIRETANMGHYVITARGIWTIELSKKVITDNLLIEYLDAEYFNNDEGNQVLPERLKIVLLSLIAARSFSKDCVADLNLGKHATEAWQKILIGSFEILKELSLISSCKKENLMEKHGNEPPAQNEFRHAGDLKKLTKNIYQDTGARGYYIDVSKGGKLSIDKLQLLFKKILGVRHLTYAEIDKLCQFLEHTFNNENVYIYEKPESTFLKPEYSVLIRDALITL